MRRGDRWGIPRPARRPLDYQNHRQLRPTDLNPCAIAAPIAGGVNFGTYCAKDYEGRYWWYTFGYGENDLAVFQVAIQNGTDHILRMKDARIYLEVPDHDPIAPV